MAWAMWQAPKISSGYLAPVNAAQQRKSAQPEKQRGTTMADETPARAPESGAPHQHSSGPGSGSRGPRPGGPGGRSKFFRRKKVCKFCTEKIDAIPYRDVR